MHSVVGFKVMLTVYFIERREVEKLGIYVVDRISFLIEIGYVDKLGIFNVDRLFYRKWIS